MICCFVFIILIVIILVFSFPILTLTLTLIIMAQRYMSNRKVVNGTSEKSTFREEEFTKHLRKMYKCAHLHSHFSGYVASKDILGMLSDVHWDFDGKEITIKEDNLTTVDSNSKMNGVKEVIHRAWGGDFEQSSMLIGSLFFHCIKTPSMYKKYLQLIEKQMSAENISHLELRLKLGSVNGWSIEDEIKVLSNFNEELLTQNKSLIIIPQYSCHSNPKQALEYFEKVAKSQNTNIKSFDIVGCEQKGKLLREFNLNAISEIMGPPVMHAGEFPGEKSSQNMLTLGELNKKFPIRRVGHGLNNPNWKKLPVDTIFEYCPITYAAERINTSAVMKILNASRPIIVVGADDCNKLRDKNLNDNFVFLWKRGVSYFKLQCSLLYSIIGSFATDKIKTYMLSMWYLQYCKYYKYVDTKTEFVFYALDKDCKWFIRTNKPAGSEMIEKLENLTEKFMKKAFELTKLTENNKNPDNPDTTDIICKKLVTGMELYAYKPSFSREVTWTTEEYNMPEFQFTYIRLKSLQRYTECYTMYERIFNGINTSNIKTVLAIGGGAGFEIIALRDYLQFNPTATIIDIAESWKVYSELIGCEYVIDDVNNISDTTLDNIARADLIIFSYVFKYLKDSFFAVLNAKFSDKMLIFNERNQPINDKIPVVKITSEIFVRNIDVSKNTPDLTFLSE